MILDYTKAGRVATFTLNRPDAMNAHNLELHQAMQAALDDFRNDPDLWVGIVTGAGDKAFSAGADIKELFPYWRTHQAQRWKMPLEPMHGFELWKPMIAAVNGWALGGGMELALACDIRIASEQARFGQPEVKVGVLPAGGATWRLPRQIPWCHAAAMIMAGKTIDAREAYRLGLVNEVVAPDQLMASAQKWADDICRCAPLAVRASKEAMVRGAHMSWEEGGRLEFAMFGYLLNTRDLHEGADAFAAKRKPRWKGA